MSSVPVARDPAVPADADLRPSLTVLSGFWPAATYAVARSLLAAGPSMLLVRYDLHGAGYVRRVMSTETDRISEERGDLLHGCVSRTLRDDVLPTMARLARTHPGQDILLMLPPVVEPETVATACARCLVDGVALTELIRVDSYVTVLDAEYLLDGLGNGDDLVTLGIQATDDDHRSLADVVVRQIEYADTHVLWGSRSDGPLGTAQVHALLHRLAPWATRVHLDGDRINATALARHLRNTHRHDPRIPSVLARGVEGYPLGIHEPHPQADIVSAVFRAHRPFHPKRLHDLAETANVDVIRSRGHLWLASQPDTVVTWDFAGGGLALGTLGRWLAAVPDSQWLDVSAYRRVAAALDWDPYYGDRHHHLAFIGLDLDAAQLHRTLSSCLLTDAELADGEAVWRTYPDPFAGCFPVPDIPLNGQT
ncbi:CobW family GTP-binding protein [Micromonospora sp. CPCC 206061]|uniref:CobW family GTP-binding protein n=1 Tax=Micromonospora sp. CPCC 206061 TaxID=3122410 RepID=UPI002FF43061